MNTQEIYYNLEGANNLILNGFSKNETLPTLVKRVSKNIPVLDCQVILAHILNLPKEEFKYICKACNEGIDPTFHKWTKQQGSYFHKVCWKNALNYANKKGII
jgi:hypothetical protein